VVLHNTELLLCYQGDATDNAARNREDLDRDTSSQKTQDDATNFGKDAEVVWRDASDNHVGEDATREECSTNKDPTVDQLGTSVALNRLE